MELESDSPARFSPPNWNDIPAPADDPDPTAPTADWGAASTRGGSEGKPMDDNREVAALSKSLLTAPMDEKTQVSSPAHESMDDKSETLAINAGWVTVKDGKQQFNSTMIERYFLARAMLPDAPNQDPQAHLAAKVAELWPKDNAKPAEFDEIMILLAGMLPATDDLVLALITRDPCLALRCILDSGGVEPTPTTRATLQNRLVEIATGETKSVLERNRVGNLLNRLVDTRPGVWLNDGLPDLVWCEVPVNDLRVDDLRLMHQRPLRTQLTSGRRTLPDNFLISKYPVTVIQFNAFVTEGGYAAADVWADGWQWKVAHQISGPLVAADSVDHGNHPVVDVSWYEANAFCRWLSRRLHCIVRLPTEAAWEHAALPGAGGVYPWGGDKITAEHANYCQTGLATTSPVGIFPQGNVAFPKQAPLGDRESSTASYHVCDMAGNVWEWLAAASPPVTRETATSAAAGSMCPLRGGSYRSLPLFLRHTSRIERAPGTRQPDIGFRVMCTGF